MTFKDFSKKTEDFYVTKFGDGLKTPDADIDLWFDACNLLTPGTDGVSTQDVFALGPLRRAIFPEQ